MTEQVAFPKKPYGAILFDCDGTLTDSMPVHYVAWFRTMQRFGISFPEDRFYALGGVPSDKIVRMLADEQGIDVDIETAAMQKEEEFLRILHLIQPIPPVMEVAKHFRGRIPMAVASGGFRTIIHQQLERLGCNDWFSTIVTAEDTHRHKPFPDVFLLAAKRLEVAPADCLVYEDSDLGIEAAEAAGMDWIDVRTFHQPKRIPV